MHTGQPVQGVAASRLLKILHRGLIAGLVIVAAVFVYVRRTVDQAFLGAPVVGYVTAAVGLINLVVAIAFLLPRIPPRSGAEAPDDYWSRFEVRTASIILWALVEGAGLVALVGYLLTGSLAAAVVVALAIAALMVARPTRIEGDGA